MKENKLILIKIHRFQDLCNEIALLKLRGKIKNSTIKIKLGNEYDLYNDWQFNSMSLSERVKNFLQDESRGEIVPYPYHITTMYGNLPIKFV